MIICYKYTLPAIIKIKAILHTNDVLVDFLPRYWILAKLLMLWDSEHMHCFSELINILIL